jgi:hypothetical protein
MARLIPILLVLCSLNLPASAQEWRIDFGPYLGYYDFDEITQFEDGGMFGFRLGIHRDHWFRFEAEFDEVYTNRDPVGNAARQVTLAVHGRFEPQSWRFAPSALIGVGMVMLDDSDQPDAFGEGYDVGVGLAWRVSDSWRIRGEYLARYQRFRVRDPGAPIDDPDAASEREDLWAGAYRIGAFYEFPRERGGAPASYPLSLGLYAGYWNFSSTFRYENDAVFGLRGSAGLFPWFALQVELDQITTSNKRTDDWAQAISFSMHGLAELRSDKTWRPGLLFGVSFMGLDSTGDIDTISEGFDLGPSLRVRGNDRIGIQADWLFRYQSVRVNRAIEEEEEVDEIDYVWSSGLRLGVNVVF